LASTLSTANTMTQRLVYNMYRRMTVQNPQKFYIMLEVRFGWYTI